MPSSLIDERNRQRLCRDEPRMNPALETPGSGKRKPPLLIDPWPRGAPSERRLPGHDAVLLSTRNPQPWRSRRKSTDSPERPPPPRRLPKTKPQKDGCHQTRCCVRKKERRKPMTNPEPSMGKRSKRSKSMPPLRGWNSRVARCQRASNCICN